MVKRKRTLSIKENSESVSQGSDGDLGGEEAKRLKAHGSVVNVEGSVGAPEAAPTHQNHAAPNEPLSPSAHRTSNSSVPSANSQPVSNVPSSAAAPPPAALRPTLQLRTSARVLNKQRREETKADQPPPPQPLNAKKPDPGALDGEFGEEEDGKKRRRAWELWSLEDKNIFFESINECGKDFEAIQNYLTAKLRKKGAPRSQVKNKDQVRHFYYRTWHKISKHITFNEGVKKATQELYGLINFGELRKKVGGTLDERKAQKLQELIRKGSTSVRVKGKSVRVRTPICRALKKLNQIEEHREQAELRLPASVMVEVVPASMQAWCRVQALAHNPRIRFTTSLRRPLALLISHLQEKWRNSNLKLRDTLCSHVTFPLKMEAVPEPVLRLMPVKGATIKPISVQPEVMLKSSSLSLSSHEARLRRRGEKVGRGGRRKDTKHQQEKEAEDKALRDTEGHGGEAKGATGPGERKGRGEVEAVELEDLGEVSQEEHDDCSDGEACCPNSPDDDVVRVSPDKATTTTTTITLSQIKEEPPDTDFPSSPKEEFDPNLQVKEESESESGDTLRQLLALETVAGAGAFDGDADVVCTGESTRLTAHVGVDPHPRLTHPTQQQQQSVVLEEERVTATTPEPEEEEKPPSTETVEAVEVDMKAWMQKIRNGWTLASATGISIGELYLILGQNKKICLEYDFEDPTKIKENTEDSSGEKSEGVVVEGQCITTTTTAALTTATSTATTTTTATNTATTTTTTTAATSTATTITTTTTTSVPVISGEGVGTDSGGPTPAEKEQQEQQQGKDGSDSGGDATKDEKQVAAENLSGMLAQLLAMTRMILNKPAIDSTCPCGHICSRGSGVLRSPAGGRSHSLVGRSPGSTRSPRTSKLALASSPNVAGVKSPGGQGGLGSRPLRERNKPASAKKLMAETMEPHASVSYARDGEAGTTTMAGVEVTIQASTTTTFTTTTPSNPDALQVPMPGISTGPSAAMPGLKVVMGAGRDAGEFKVPQGPAPRQLHVQQANFNAQLSKLLPRYNNRPGRRLVRKNVVVQRQLPLLPKAVVQLPSHDKDGGSTSGYISITIAPSPKGITSPASSAFTRSAIATPSSSQSLAPVLSPSLMPVRNKIIQPIHSPSNQATTSTVLQPMQAPSTLGVANTPMQVSVLSPLPTPAAPQMPSLSPGTNAISVNISGQPLLTVEMPPIVSTQASMPALTTLTPAPTPPAPPAPLPVENSTSVTSAVSVPHSPSSIENRQTNGLLSSVVSQVLNELPDLSTPPGTPQPSLNKNGDQGSLQVTSLNNSASLCHPASPPIVFGSTLPVEPLPDLHTPILEAATTSMTTVTTMPQSASTTLSPTPLLTIASTHHLELSPPPTQTNTFSSLLNTPTPSIDRNVTSTPVRAIFPSTPSISSLLSSPPDLSKGFPNLLAGSEETQDGSGAPESGGIVPELHIPEGSVSLPLLDISLGGTVTIADQAPGGLLGTGSQPTLREQLAAAHSPPHIASVLPHSPPPLPASSMISLNTGSQDSSSADKLMDITLGNSNSNSSFSSLLAAATQPLLDATTGDPQACVVVGRAQGLGEVGGGEVGGIAGGRGSCLVGDTSGFPTLSNTPPSPPSSPSRLLQQSDTQWLNNEVNDFSLSSFLGHFESPVKNNSNSRGASQTSPQTPFMPSLSSVYNENSVDFTATFAEMKAQVSGSFKQ
ncbi:mucin-5AC-like isoform X2 [Portunus trituberculatus]|uniref:mucin-5AC-like isoform X2 n=1 Tax=Portunus trituberculatus TaxID=210409 RepID=UPI001E1CB8F1|nr:mucin-5AC-like isoform X2 [Portunus trituberculatus]